MIDAPRILLAGVGNIFFGDDAFGVEVVRRLLAESPMDGVCVVDFGIRGVDLTYALLEKWDAAILVDATPRGSAPGTLYVVEPDRICASEVPQDGPLLDAHSMDPVKVLQAVSALGGETNTLFVVGCEPTPVDEEEDMQMGLSQPVAAVIDEAVRMVRSLVAKIRADAITPAAIAAGE